MGGTVASRGSASRSPTHTETTVLRFRRLAGCALFVGVLALFSAVATAQVAVGGVPKLPIDQYPALELRGPARPGAYVADVGRRAAVFGDETGALEVWVWPLKLVHDLHLAFRIPDYDEPISAAAVARSVSVRPDGFTITYSHATFTVRQHVLVPLEEPAAIVLLDVQTVRPLDVLVRMHADFGLAWPGSFGGAFTTWSADDRAFLFSQGGLRRFNAFVGSPYAVQGTSHAAHDAPAFPSQMVLRFPPERGREELIPMVMAAGAAPRDSVLGVYRRVLTRVPELWEEKVRHIRDLLSSTVALRSPEPILDDALRWATVNLDQQLVCNGDLGCGLVAGFGKAGARNFRPGFGWYFGGDAAINSFAMDAAGQLELVRGGLEFLAGFQREDGKIPHEISHAAAYLPWFTDYPYTWFHGDTTPFWILACYEYWKASADDDFLRRMAPRLVRGFRWSAATDTDGDGLMENPVAGAGAIEVGGLGEALHTDIYLAGVWAAALEGMARMAAHLGDDALAVEATTMGRRARASLESDFWLEPEGIYAFALLRAEGGAAEGAAPVADRPALRLNQALTVWPATAMSFGLLRPDRAERMLRRLSASDVTVDWGARLLSSEHPLYEPLHYNNGAVWPFMTGFVALAHYRYHRAWAGHDLLRDVARTTYDFALGHHPELMSGAFYRTLDTTVPHQFFATSMLVTPLLRGLLGWDADAPAGRLTLSPHLPAEWDSVQVGNVPVGEERLHVQVTRKVGAYRMAVSRSRSTGRPLTVRLSPALPLGAQVDAVVVGESPARAEPEPTSHDLHVPIEAPMVDSVVVEWRYHGGAEVAAPTEDLRVGDPPKGLRVRDLVLERGDYVLDLEGRSGAEYTVRVRAEQITDVRGATLEAIGASGGLHLLHVTIPGEGEGYRDHRVRFRVAVQ